MQFHVDLTFKKSFCINLCCYSSVYSNVWIIKAVSSLVCWTNWARSQRHFKPFHWFQIDFWSFIVKGQMYLHSEKKCISQNVKRIFFLRGCSLCGSDPVLLKTIKISLPWNILYFSLKIKLAKVCVFVNHHKQKSYGLTVTHILSPVGGPGGPGRGGLLRGKVLLFDTEGEKQREQI